MRYLITYYSYSGNTDKVVGIISEMLKSKGSEAMVQRLRPKDEIHNFFAQCKAAFLRKRAVLAEEMIFNTSKYDFIMIGSPVWAFAPTPAINTYLDHVSGLDGKTALVFLTYGSGTGVRRCFKEIKSVLKRKGIVKIYEVNIPARRIDDRDFIRSNFEKLLD